MSLDLESLRERLTDSLRARLPADDALLSWWEALGPELADTLCELPASELEEALRELVQAGRDALPALRRLEELVPQKQARKMVRRSLHRLKSRGIDVGDSSRGERRSVLAPLEEQLEQGAVTPPDPLGRRALFLFLPVRGGTRIYEILLSDIEGVLHLERVEARRPDARSFLRRLQEERKGRILRVEGAAVRALVRRAQESRSGSAAPAIDPKLLAELLAGESTETPGEQVRSKLMDAAQRLTQNQADTVLRQRVERRELPAWLLAGEDVQEAARELGELERSQLVLSAVQKRERAHKVLSRAAERILDEATCRRLAQRLDETAAFLLEGGDEEGAAAAVRMSDIIRTARAPLEVGYLRMLLELSCGLARQKQQEEDRGKLILPS